MRCFSRRAVTVARTVLPPLSLAVLAGAAHADDWEVSAGGNSARNGRTSEFGPVTPDLLWSGGRPAIIAQQGVTEGDLLVVPRWDSFTTGGWIVAMDLQTGQERWAVQLPETTPGAGNSRPTGFRDGQVYATRSGNDKVEYLYALSPIDGSQIWRSEDLITESYTESIAFTADGDIIASKWVTTNPGSNELLRIRKSDGTIAWRSPRSVPSSNGLGATVFGDRVYIWEATPTGPQVTAFNADTGQRLYSTGAVSGGLVQQTILMAGPDGTIYAPRFQNNPATDFFVAYTDTGSALVEKWRKPMGYLPFGTFAVGNDGSVYTCDTTPPVNNTTMLTIRRRDPQTGDETAASQPILCDYPAGPRMAVDAAGTLYLTNGSFTNGALYAFNPDLTERWRLAVPNVNTSGPVIGQGGVLVVCGVGNNVRAFRAAAAPCYANCDESTAAPVLNVNDFICFQARYAAGDAYANCDNSTTPPVLNVNDFICFQASFAAGCP